MRHQPSLHEQALGQRNSAELLAGRGESDVLTARHARWYARLAEPADFLQHTDCPRFWPVLEIEIENLRAAARWAIDHEPCPGAPPSRSGRGFANSRVDPQSPGRTPARRGSGGRGPLRQRTVHSRQSPRTGDGTVGRLRTG